MTQASQGTVIWSIVISTILILAMGVYAVGQIPAVQDIEIPTADDVASSVLEKVTIPTAAEIAALVSVPDTSSKQLQEVWDELYSFEVGELEEAALELCEEEFEWDDVVDMLELAFGSISDVDFEDFDADDRDITIRDLGLDDDDDREVEVEGYFTVSYMPEEGEQIAINDKVHGTCLVTSDDGVLEAELELRL